VKVILAEDLIGCEAMLWVAIRRVEFLLGLEFLEGSVDLVVKDMAKADGFDFED
jgi:hypothetical protein